MKISELIAEEKIRLIRNYFVDREDLTAGTAKEALGDKVTWGELRMVLAQLRREL